MMSQYKNLRFSKAQKQNILQMKSLNYLLKEISLSERLTFEKYFTLLNSIHSRDHFFFFTRTRITSIFHFVDSILQDSQVLIDINLNSLCTQFVNSFGWWIFGNYFGSRKNKFFFQFIFHPSRPKSGELQCLPKNIPLLCHFHHQLLLYTA